MLHKEKTHPVFVALTRPTCILGVGVDYLFAVMISVYSLFLLADDPRLFFIAVPCFLFGRWCYSRDAALMGIFQQRMHHLNQASYQQLGVSIYDPF